MNETLMDPAPASDGVAAPLVRAPKSPRQTYTDWLDRPASPRLHGLPSNPNSAYAVWLLSICLLLTAAALWPVLRDLLFGYCRVDCSAEFGHSPLKPFYRTDFFWLTATAFVLLMGLQRRWRRIPELRKTRAVAALVAFVWCGGLNAIHSRVVSGQRLMGAVATGAIFEQQWQNMQRLKIIECHSTQLKMADIRADLHERPLRNFTELHHAVMDHYAVHAPRLKARWANLGTLSERKRKTLFILNLVSGLWSFGNKDDLQHPGSVFCNEQNRDHPPPPSLETYLNAKIACCTDFALLTKSLLDHEGIENRLTAIPGHVFNEAKLDGRWCIVDVSANIFIAAGWDELFDDPPPGESIEVFVFPHASLLDQEPSRYRPLTGCFRLMTLLRAANRPQHLRQADHPILPDYFD